MAFLNINTFISWFLSDLLYSGDGYEYYKVPVTHGERLVEGKVAETCEAAGLKAVCTGPDDGCQFTDTSKCLVTPLASLCTKDVISELVST